MMISMFFKHVSRLISNYIIIKIWVLKIKKVGMALRSLAIFSQIKVILRLDKALEI